MRMRLARNYNGNRHEDASKMRDTGETTPKLPSKPPADKELLAKVTKRISTSLEEDEVLLEQLWSDANSPAIRGAEGPEDTPTSFTSSGTEKKLMKAVKCHLVLLMESIAGVLDVTNKHLYFLSDQSEKHQSSTCESMLPLGVQC